MIVKARCRTCGMIRRVNVLYGTVLCKKCTKPFIIGMFVGRIIATDEIRAGEKREESQ